MANTPQAKKRIRRNANRADDQRRPRRPHPDLHQGRRSRRSNRARRPMPPTALKAAQPEMAQGRCRAASSTRTPRPANSRGCPSESLRWAKFSAPEFAPKFASYRRPSGSRRQVPFRDLSKNPAFPAIRVVAILATRENTAVFRHFPSFPRLFTVKLDYFIFVKKHGLKAGPRLPETAAPGASLRRGQDRETATGAATRVRRSGPSLSRANGREGGRRASARRSILIVCRSSPTRRSPHRSKPPGIRSAAAFAATSARAPSTAG